MRIIISSGKQRFQMAPWEYAIRILVALATGYALASYV